MSSRYLPLLTALLSLLCCIPTTAQLRRERNTDFWDSDTLAYFLDEYPGYDAAVMFYAQWDSNSHAFAPYYDRIATMLGAGTTDSRLIMAYFDCEASQPNSQLCEAVGVAFYPTILFIGSGPYHDTDPFTRTLFGKKKSAGPMGNAPIPNTVKFQGNWQMPDSILDWIRTMQALSNWHTWTTKGFGKRLRNFLLPHKKTTTPLPLGIPGSDKQGGSSSSASSSADVEILETVVEKLSNRTKDLEKIAVRSTVMMETVLFSAQEDMFALMSESGAWTRTEGNTPTQDVLKNCILEVSLDYCQRVGARAANDLVEELDKQGKSLEEIVEMEDLEELVVDLISKSEPFCAILDECVLSGMEDKKCRPATCPFVNPQACSYLTSCLDPDIQQEYAEAMGVDLVAETAASGAGSTSGWF